MTGVQTCALPISAIAVAAERRLLSVSPLSGGQLVPAWGGASALWSEYLQGFHPAGIGSAASTPPYVVVIALLATVLGGKPWLAVDVILIGCIPLAGVTAYAVAQRRKEIGIRMALGARRGQVLRLVLREGAALAGVGTVLGFLGAVVLAKMLSALTSIFVDALKVGTNDLRLLLGAPLLLAGLALLACYVPARRAVKVDPLQALREG